MPSLAEGADSVDSLLHPAHMHLRAMRRDDAETVAAIYNEGIRGRGATFQTAERTPADVAPWVDEAARFPVVVADRDGEVIGWARASQYSAFPPYAGVGEL